MIWEYIIPAVFGAAVLIQLVYLLFIFTTLINHKNVESETVSDFPAVSVVLAAWNELHNLKELLPLLDNQDYPDFEVIVVDDRSSDGTYDYLRTNEGQFSKVSYVHVKALPEHFTAKKYAVTMGIKKASKEVILLTDADCRPANNQWIKSMAAQLEDESELVLGFSPYYVYPGLLNAFIRYETFQTALQYFSFAKVGIPFMGVGRNLMYSREKFWRSNGFTKHIGLLSGDDDLFVNEISNKANTMVCTSPDSFMYSEPKRTFKDWLTQKRRHLSVGKRYKFRDKITIGLLWMSFITLWCVFLPAFFAEPSWFVLPEQLRVSDEWLLQYGFQHYKPITNWKRTVCSIFVLWMVLRWFILHMCNRSLGKSVRSSKILYYDFLYFLYLVVFGVMTVFSNPKKIKWR